MNYVVKEELGLTSDEVRKLQIQDCPEKYKNDISYSHQKAKGLEVLECQKNKENKLVVILMKRHYLFRCVLFCPAIRSLILTKIFIAC